jgi:hypothetical protein
MTNTTSMNPKDLAAMDRVPMHLLPKVGLIWGAMACREGAIKYGPYNWRERDIKLSEYIGAIERHLSGLNDGEWIDPKSGIPHLGKIIATAAIVLDAYHNGSLIIDIGEGPAADLIFELEERIKAGEFKVERPKKDG